MENVLEELLLVLAGNASDLFVVVEVIDSKQPKPWCWTLQAHANAKLHHPGEKDLFNSLANIAAKYKRVKLFISSIQNQIKRQTLQAIRQRCKANDWQNVLLARLVSGMADLLIGYENCICDIQSDILHGQWEFNSDGSSAFVSISNIRARLEEWEGPLRALDQLVSELLSGPSKLSFEKSLFEKDTLQPPKPPSCPYWGSGQLLDLLSRKSETSVGFEHNFMIKLLETIEDQWCHGLVAWMCYGQAKVDTNSDLISMEEPIIEWVESKDPLNMSTLSASLPINAQLPHLISSAENDLDSPDQKKGFQLKPNSAPSWIKKDSSIANAILYVGKSLFRVREHSKKSTKFLNRNSDKSTGLPTSLTNTHVQLLRSSESRVCSKSGGFRKAIEQIQNELSEWMWQNILTDQTVFSTFETLGGYFLHRNGLFISSFLQRLSQLRKSKIISARTAAAASIRAPDIELALQRACIGTEAEDDSDKLALFEIEMPKSSNTSQSQSDNWKTTSWNADSKIRFDDIAIGIPFKIRYHARFPLDTILSPFELNAYTDLFSYLLALESVRIRLRDCWMTLSRSQRARRRFTGVGEGGGDRTEERKRMDLLRMACGLAREGNWFLEVLDGHFHSDIVDVQFTKFLQHFRKPETTGSLNKTDSGSIVSVDKWRQKITQNVRRVSSMGTLREEDSEEEKGRSSPSIGAMEFFSQRPPRKTNAKSVFGGSQMTHNSQFTGTTKKKTVKDKRPNGMDFATSRACHQAFLAYVLEGLLLTNVEASKCIWRILHTCRHFTSLIDRWGGDILPELLSEGSIMDDGPLSGMNKSKMGTKNEEGSLPFRIKAIKEISFALRQHLDEFFVILSDASMAASKRNTGKRSVHPSIVQRNFVETKGKQKEILSIQAAQNAALRHHEQLLLRLDFNNFISQRHSDQDSGQDRGGNGLTE